MKIIDLHCDTISCLSQKGHSLLNNQNQFDIKRAQAANIWVQFMALFTMPTDSNTSLRLMMKQLDKFLSEINSHSSHVFHLKNSEELYSISNANKIGCLLHMEGAECLGSDIEILRLLYHLGLRSIGLTWNNRNLLADGIGEGEQAGGLSQKGKEVLKEMADLGVMLDLAHISKRSYYDALGCYPKPIMVTHANARALCPHWRNLDDKQLKALAEHGGIIGITQVADFVKEVNPTPDDMLNHIVYIADLIGVQHIALGSDFDGADNMVISEVSGYGNLSSMLIKRGFALNEIEMILNGNALGVIKEII